MPRKLIKPSKSHPRTAPHRARGPIPSQSGAYAPRGTGPALQDQVPRIRNRARASPHPPRAAAQLSIPEPSLAARALAPVVPHSPRPRSRRPRSLRPLSGRRRLSAGLQAGDGEGAGRCGGAGPLQVTMLPTRLLLQPAAKDKHALSCSAASLAPPSTRTAPPLSSPSPAPGSPRLESRRPARCSWHLKTSVGLGGQPQRTMEIAAGKR